MSLITLEFNHKNTIDAREIEALADEGSNLISALEDEIEALKEEKEELEEGEEDNDEDNSNRLNQIAIEITGKEKEIEDLQKDVDHLQNAYDILSSYSETAIADDHLECYIRSNIEECYTDELENLPEVIRSNIGWSGVIEDAKTDYSELNLDGCTYHFS